MLRKGQLNLSAAKFNPVIFVTVGFAVQHCECVFCCYFASPLCCLNNFMMKSYRFNILKATCIAWIRVNLKKRHASRLENFVLQMLPSQTRLPNSIFQQLCILHEVSVIKSATKISFFLKCFVCCRFPNNRKFINDFWIHRTSYLPLFIQNETLEQDNTNISEALSGQNYQMKYYSTTRWTTTVFRNLTPFLLCWV